MRIELIGIVAIYKDSIDISGFSIYGLDEPFYQSGSILIMKWAIERLNFEIEKQMQITAGM